MDEVSLVNFTHEVQHTMQHWSLKSARKPEDSLIIRSQRVLMETVNELTIRDSYPEILKELGRDAIYSERIKKDSFVYQYPVSNFYALLAWLGIKGETLEKLLTDLTRINETKEVV